MIEEKSLRQLVTAASDGAIATTEAIKYINKNTLGVLFIISTFIDKC